VLIEAAQEVGPGLFFSLLIIVVSFLPVFALTGESYRLFSPLAFTKTYAMAFGALLSVTLIPVLMIWLLRGKMRPETANPLNRFFVWIYKPVMCRLKSWGQSSCPLSMKVSCFICPRPCRACRLLKCVKSSAKPIA